MSFLTTIGMNPTTFLFPDAYLGKDGMGGRGLACHPEIPYDKKDLGVMSLYIGFQLDIWPGRLHHEFKTNGILIGDHMPTICQYC